jgi:uncharacterized protein (UPF0212 family)
MGVFIMAIEVITTECPQCGSTIAGTPGWLAKCPGCGIQGKIAGVTLPDWLLWLPLGIVLGVIFAKSKHVAEYSKKVVAKL